MAIKRLLLPTNNPILFPVPKDAPDLGPEYEVIQAEVPGEPGRIINLARPRTGQVRVHRVATYGYGVKR
jgi:hypothetical protein